MHITVHKSKSPACSLVVETGNKQINKCLGTKHRGGQKEELVVSQRHEGMVFKSRGLQAGTGASHADPASGAGTERRGHGGRGKNTCPDLEASTRQRNHSTLLDVKCREQGHRGIQHPGHGRTS